MPIEARVGVNTGEVVVRSITDRRGSGRIHADRAYHQPRLADAGGGADRLDRGQRAYAQALRGLLPPQAAGPDQSQRRQRAGQRLRSDRAGAAAHAVAACGGSRADEVRRARARDGGAASTRPSRRKLGPRADCRGDGRSRASASRGCSSSSRPRSNPAGWCWRRSRSRTARRRAYLPVIDLLHGYFKIAGEDDRTHAAREGHRQGLDARSRAGRHAAVSVQSARHRRGRRSAGADGRAVEEAAHARGDQTHPPARDRSISR